MLKLALIRLLPSQIEALSNCLSSLSPPLQILDIVLFAVGMVLFFVGGAFSALGRSGKYHGWVICFAFGALCLCSSLILLGFGCS